MKNGRFLILCLSLVTLTSCGGEDVVTYSDFEKIKPGMTLDEVEKMIGRKGVLANKDEYSDGMIVPTIPGEQVYYWQNKNESNLNISILNGRVNHKAETDLH